MQMQSQKYGVNFNKNQKLSVKKSVLYLTLQYQASKLITKKVKKKKKLARRKADLNRTKKIKEVLSTNYDIELKNKELELQKLQEDILKLNQQVKQTDLALVNQPSMDVVEEDESEEQEKSILIIDKSREFELSSSEEEEDEFDQVNQRDSYTITKNKKSKLKDSKTYGMSLG